MIGRHSFALLLCGVCLFARGAGAQFGKPASHAAARLVLNTDHLVPGQQAIACVVVDVDEGYHAQSSAPLDENYLPFIVTGASSSAFIATLDPLYPPGDLVDFPALGGKLSTYAGRVLTFVPFVVAEGATPGDVELTAVVDVQVCNDETCDPPKKLNASIKTRIAPAGEPPSSTNGELFKTFDPNRWLNKHAVATSQATTGAAGPATSAAWTPFGEAALADARRGKMPAIVEFTAAWCVNCHVIERRVYGDAATQAELAKRGVTLIKVDLTDDGAPGTELLRSLNPSRSIPFTAIYLPGRNAPATLSGIYDSTALLKLIDDRGASQQSSTSILGIELKILPWPAVALLAFGVGILLNAVPCVLPVLPLKAASFYENAGHSRGKSFAYGLAFSAGIVAMFGGLALFVITTDALWSKVISSPWVAAGLAVVLVFAALQAFGALEFVLPGAISNLDAAGGTYVGNFFSGALIAVLSTPCTVGIFAAVIAFSLTSGAVIGTIILMAAGAGMAAPWLALSALPEVTAKFPRTGPWPSVVKQMTGFLLLATAAFFAVPVLPVVLRGAAVSWTIFALIAASAVFLLARTVQLAPRPRPIAISSTVAVLLTAAGLGLTLLLGG